MEDKKETDLYDIVNSDLFEELNVELRAVFKEFMEQIETNNSYSFHSLESALQFAETDGMKLVKRFCEDTDFQRHFGIPQTKFTATVTEMYAIFMKDYFFRNFHEMYSEQIFDFIKDYPDSSQQLEDFDAMLQYLCKTDNYEYREDLLVHLKNQLNERLLHVGVSTSQILHVYVSTLMALKIVGQENILI